MARESEIVLKVGSTAVNPRVSSASRPAARYSAFVVIAELTGVGGVTCDIVVEESWNNGADWFEVAHFTQLSAGLRRRSHAFTADRRDGPDDRQEQRDDNGDARCGHDLRWSVGPAASSRLAHGGRLRAARSLRPFGSCSGGMSTAADLKLSERAANAPRS